MTEKDRASRIGIVSAVGLGCVLLGVMWLPALTRAAPLLLPPLNTQTPYPTGQATPVRSATPQVTATSAPAPSAPPRGGFITLRAPSAHAEMWTLVQWQNEWDNWYDVTGWQGTFDEITYGVGTKTWWVAREGFGTGPFRWVVHESAGGAVVATSESFYLPDIVGEMVTVEAWCK